MQLPHPPLFLACTNPETVRRAASYGVGPMVLGFGGPEMIGDMRRMFDEERARRDPEAMVSPGMVNDEFVALCPTFLMDDRDEAFRKGCRALRFFAEAITHWAAPNGVAPARDTAHVDNAAFMAEHLQMAKDAIARGEAPPTAASSMYNTDHALGDADTAIAYVERLRDRGRRQRHVPDPDGHARARRDDGVDPHLRRAGDPALPRPRRHRRRRERAHPSARLSLPSAPLSILSIEVIGSSATTSSRSGAL